MKKKISILLMLAMIMSSAVTASADAADDTMVVGIPSLTESFDFFNTTNGYESFSMAQVYDNLIRKDGEGNYVPGLADSYEIDESAQVFTFHLNPDAKWTDGTPVTSADVAFSMEKLKESDYVSYIYEPILDSIETPDDQTVIINLTKPSVSLMEYLANPYYSAVLSKAAYEEFGDQYGTSVDTIVSSGPYKLTEWNIGESMVYEANPDYYREAPAISNVKLVVMNDSNSAMTALQTGEINAYFDDVPGVARATVETLENVSIYDYTSTILYCVFFNTQNGMFTDPNMRKAVATAINKDDYIIVGSEGYGQPADYPGDRGDIGDPGLHGIWDENYAVDLEAAAKLVEEAGHAGDSVVIKTYASDPYPALATVMQNALTQIGLNATVEQIERATFIDTVLGKGDFEIQICRWAAATEDMDEIIYGSLHTDSIGSPGNWSFYESPAEIDALIEQAAAETDEAARKELYGQVIQNYIDDMVYVSLYYPTSSRAYSSDLEIGDGLQRYDLFMYYSWK